MTRDTIADQPSTEVEEINDELPEQDREAAEEAARALLFLAERSPMPNGTEIVSASAKSSQAHAAIAVRPGRLECRFSLPAANLVAAMAAVHLPPSDLSKLVNRHLKPLTKPLHQLCLTVDAKGLRLTNRKEGVACELTVPIRNFSTSGAAAHCFLVSFAHLQGLLPDRPYRVGNRRLANVDWTKMPDVELAYCRPDRRLTVRVGASSWDLPAEPGDSPDSLPKIADDIDSNHGLVARMLEKAIRYAGTFSALGRKDPMYGVISIEDGVAWGGFPGAASQFESAILKGVSLDIAVADAPAVRSLLLRLQNFRMLVDADRLLLGDDHIRVAIELAKHRVPDISAAIATSLETGIAIEVSLHQLFHAAEVATLLQRQETDRQPIYIDATLCEEEGTKLLKLHGITPAGYNSWVPIPIRSPREVAASDEILWTARSAHLKRAAVHSDCNEVAKVVSTDKLVLLVLEREGAVLTHILSAPKVKRPRPVPVDAMLEAAEVAERSPATATDEPEAGAKPLTTAVED